MIKRIFLDWKRPFISQVAHYLWSGLARESSVPSFAGFTVVVSSSRAGRALLDRLTEKAPRGAMIPPRIVTVGALPELLLEEDPVFGHIDYASRAEELAAWMTAMQSLDPRERELLIPELPSTGAVDQWWRLAEEFQTLWRELASGGATFGDAARIAADTAMEKEESRFGALGHLFEAYERTLSDLGRCDRLLVRARALREGFCAHRGTIFLAGVVELPRVTARMLEQSQSDITSIIHAPEEMADYFTAHGEVATQSWIESRWQVPERMIYVASDAHDLAFEVIRQLKVQLARRTEVVSAGQISLAVLDRSLLPAIRQALREEQIDIHDGEGIPSSRVDGVSALALLSRYAESRSFDDFARAVRHPVMMKLLESHGVIAGEAILDRAHELHLPRRIIGSIGELRAAGSPVREVARLVQIFEEQFTELFGAEPLPVLLALDAVARTIAIIETHLVEDLSVSEGMELVSGALSELADAALALPPLMTVPQAAAAALYLMSKTRAADPQQGNAIEVIGWLEAHLDEGRELMVCGVNEGVIPEVLHGDQWLPHEMRRALGMTTNEERFARDIYLLQVLVSSRPDLALFLCRRSTEGEALLPSRVLLQEDSTVVSARLTRFFSFHGGGSPPIRASLAQPILRAPNPAEHPPLHAVSVSGFKDYLQCPYRFYLRHVLRLTERDDTERELNPRLFGTVLHAVLERFGRSDLRTSTNPREITAFCFTLLDEIVGRQFGKVVRAAVPLQVEQMRRRLRIFAEHQAAWCASGWQIEACEQRFDPASDLLELDDGTLLGIAGRIDRIDLHSGTGERVVIDYKTSERALAPDAMHRGRDGWTDLQLPAYHYLLRKRDVSAELRLAYFNLAALDEECGFAFAAWSSEELADAVRCMKEVGRNISRQQFWPPCFEIEDSFSPLIALASPLPTHQERGVS